MNRVYGVLWSDGDEIVAGRLRFDRDGLELSGRRDGRRVEASEVRSVAIARRAADRLRGLPALVLGLRSGETLRIASLEGAGVLHEVAGRVVPG